MAVCNSVDRGVATGGRAMSSPPVTPSFRYLMPSRAVNSFRDISIAQLAPMLN